MEIKVNKDKDIAKGIVDDVKKIRNDRSAYEKQWLVNVAFLMGKQYFDLERKDTGGIEQRIFWELKSIQRKKKTQRTANYLLPLYRSLLARLLMMKANITVEPTTRMATDKDKARVAKEVLGDFWDNVNSENIILCRKTKGMLQVLKRLFGYMLSIGVGYLIPYFNPYSKGKSFLNGEIVEGDIGQIETYVKSPFEVFENISKGYIIVADTINVNTVNAQYKSKLKAEDLKEDSAEQRLLSMLEGNSEVKIEDSVRVYQKWVFPSKEYPNGRLIICSGEEVLDKNDSFPEEYKGRLPILRFDYLDFMFSEFAQGMLDQLVSLQESYNFTVSKIEAYKKWLSGKILVPDGAKLRQKIDDEVGQVLIYRSGYGKPDFANPPSAPSILLEDLLRIRRDMEDIAGIHDGSMGREPSQAKSGVAIENLTDNDNSQLAPILLTIEQQLAHFCNIVLDMMSVKYSIPRILSITGNEMKAEVNTFKGEDVDGNRRIKIIMGSSMPVSKGQRQEFILRLKNEGIISPDKARELLEFAEIDSIYHSLDEEVAKNENQEIVNGNLPTAMDYEDQTIHLKIHTDFMKTEEFMKLPVTIKGYFQAHRQEHMVFMQSEIQAQAGIQGKEG